MKRSFPKFIRRLERVGLFHEIEIRAAAHNVSLRELYLAQGRVSSIASARRDVYSWLIERGKSINEVARLFDRAPSGVLKMVVRRA